MTLKTKKFIAREIVLLFSVLLLALVFFSGNHIYNFLQNRRVRKYDRQISLASKSIDSLQRIVTPLLNDNSVYRFLKANNLTEKDQATFLTTYKNPDSAKLIYNFMRANKLTDLNASSFYKKYLAQSDIEMYFQIQEQIKLRHKDLELFKAQKANTQNKLITSDDIRQNIIWFLVISFAIMYLLRPAIKLLKWSFQTLRD